MCTPNLIPLLETTRYLGADVSGGALADSGHVVTGGRVVAGAAPLAVLAPGAARTPVTAHLALRRGQTPVTWLQVAEL